MAQGYIKLYRALMDNRLWTDEPFTRGQAWVDLLMLANHKPGYFRVRGNRIDVKRGQVGWSVQRLAKRWGWSRGKAQRFLNELEIDQQIEQQKNTLSSLITITNYELYQGETDSRQNSRRTADGQQTDTNKNEKNEKKKNIGLPDWLDSSVWEDYRQHRKEIKKPMTAKAEALAVNKLDRLRGEGQDVRRVIEQSIEQGWAGLFPVKGGLALVDDVMAGGF